MRLAISFFFILVLLFAPLSLKKSSAQGTEKEALKVSSYHRFYSSNFFHLKGWKNSQFQNAIEPLVRSCQFILNLETKRIFLNPSFPFFGRTSSWQAICHIAIKRFFSNKKISHETPQAIRKFFERFFKPIRILDISHQNKNQHGRLTFYQLPPLYAYLEPTKKKFIPILAIKRDTEERDVNKIFKLTRRNILNHYNEYKEFKILGFLSPQDSLLLDEQQYGEITLPDGTCFIVRTKKQNDYSFIPKAPLVNNKNVNMPSDYKTLKNWLKQKTPKEAEKILYSTRGFFFYGIVSSRDTDFILPRPTLSLAMNIKLYPMGIPIFVERTKNLEEKMIDHLLFFQRKVSYIQSSQHGDLFNGFERLCNRDNTLSNNKRLVNKNILQADFFALIPRDSF